jgi:hypothetical protein
VRRQSDKFSYWNLLCRRGRINGTELGSTVVLSYMRRCLPSFVKPTSYLARLAAKRTHSTVMAGPFAGMGYIESSVGSAHIPKLLGIYEREVALCIEQICRNRPKLVVDLGAAEGYYAVGLARRLPRSRLIAFESSELGRRDLARLAQLNGVADRVEIRGTCTPTDLICIATEFEDATYIIDIEGHEIMLLDDQLCNLLSRSTLLVEVHEFIVPSLAESLQLRYKNTHNILCIWQQPRDRHEFPWRTAITRLLPARYLYWAVSEWRPIRMQWLWMRPISEGTFE